MSERRGTDMTPSSAEGEQVTSDDVTSMDDENELEEQRDFLLRSLDDLDAELAAGNIDQDTYRVLHDDYTARAAAVITSIEAGNVQSEQGGTRVPPMMRILTVGAIVVFAIVAAVLLAHAVGQRGAGQEITGDAQAQAGGPSTTAPIAPDIAAAKAAAAAAPRSYDARIRYARALVSASPLAAIQEYVVAARLDPAQPEPYAYAGWLTALESRQAPAGTQAELLSAGLASLNKAIKIDPTYPDAYVFKGLLLSQVENKPCEGAAAFQLFLVTAPEDHPMRAQVLSALADATRAGHCPSPSTPSTSP